MQETAGAEKLAGANAEDLDDVQKVYSNADFSDSVLEEYQGEQS